MFSSVFPRLLTAMAEGGKAVSKRSARIYTEDEMQTDTSAQYRRTLQPQEEAPLADLARKNSIATSTISSSSQSSRQTSLEAPSTVPVAGWEEGVVEMSQSECTSYSEGTTSANLDVNGCPPTFNGYSLHSSLNLDEALPTGDRPANFGVVVPGVYRSSFPKTEDHQFIQDLKLKTIVTLVQKDFPDGYNAFVRKNGIKHHVFNMMGTKKEKIPDKTMKSILRLVLDQANHPLLIHCNHGKHRTGCVVAVVRKLTGWDLGHIITEYKTYAEPKVRECDIEYITFFEPSSISNLFARDAHSRLRFLRATFVAVVVLLVWFFSGRNIRASTDRRLIDNKSSNP